MSGLKTKKCRIIASALFAGMVLFGSVIQAEELPVYNGKPVEFHVSPDGIKPFSTKDEAVIPSLDRPGRAIFNRSGMFAEYWMSSDGSAKQPFLTLFQAQLAVREHLRMNGMPTGGIKVIIHDGIYRMNETMDLVPEDSGTSEHPVVYEAAPGAKPILSGGIVIKDWSKVTSAVPGLPTGAIGNVWVAPAPSEAYETMNFRQMYVNDAKAERARTPNAGKWDKTSCWEISTQRVAVPASAVSQWRQLQRVEMVIHQSWAITNLRIHDVTLEGENAWITFRNPERMMVFSHMYPWSTHRDPYYFANAIELLDTPGEWYLDRCEGKVYYWPRPGEDMTTAVVTVPKLETVMRMIGTLERPVHDIQFKGISFEHATWLRPSEQGHVACFLGMYLNRMPYSVRRRGGGKVFPEAPTLEHILYVGRPAASVYGRNCNRLRFERCAFKNSAMAGLDLHSGTHDNAVVGCEITEIGGNGLQIGTFSDDGFETQLPYNPEDKRQLSSNEVILNNYIHHCATEDFDCVGIAAGFVRGITIAHNEVADLPYTGISVGWGWTPKRNGMESNKIINNHVHGHMKRMHDGGGIYTESNQPGSEIRGNFIESAPSWSKMIYLDNGSTGFLVKDNWTVCRTFVKREHFVEQGEKLTNIWDNNGPDASGPIRENAGLEPAYRDLLIK